MSSPTRATCCLLLLCLFAGCEDQPPPADRKLLLLSEPATRASPRGEPLVSEDVWGAGKNPWTRFKAGSWVVFELPGGVHERHLLQRTRDGGLQLVIQVRPPQSASHGWGVELLRQTIQADSWPEMAPLRSGATLSRQTHRIEGFQLELQVVKSANRTIWLSSHIPGGIVQVQETIGKRADVVRRRLVAFGSAR